MENVSRTLLLASALMLTGIPSVNAASESNSMNSIAAVQQATKKISGTVTDGNGEPIIGASVRVKGASVGSMTDLDGRFQLNAKSGDVVTITYVGFLPYEFRVGSQSSYQISMKEDDQMLDELVVVGYGVQRKSDVTGALAHIDSKKLTEMTVANLCS